MICEDNLFRLMAIDERFGQDAGDRIRLTARINRRLHCQRREEPEIDWEDYDDAGEEAEPI